MEKAAPAAIGYADVREAIMVLARDVQKMEAATARLGARLRMPDSDNYLPSPWHDDVLRYMIEAPGRVPRDLAGIMLSVATMRMRVDDIALHLSAVRGHMDAVANDATLSGSFKNDWLG